MKNFICSRCGQEKPSDEFYVSVRGRDSLCKECRRTDSRERYHANPISRRDKMMEWRHGLTLEAYNAMSEAQAYLCAICRKSEVIEGRRLSVDHDHMTGKNRLLLCSKCNHGLGNFQDDPDLLEAAAAYLRATKG